MQSKNAKSNNCKVILTGDGGDEIFGGYQRYRNAFIAKKIKYLSFFNKKIKLINTLKEEKILEYFYTKIDINHNISLFKKELKINKIKNHVKLPNWCSVEILNYFDTKHWLPEESNFKLDRSTMLNSIEGRVPFQDINLLKNISLETRDFFLIQKRCFELLHKDLQILPQASMLVSALFQ